MLISARLAQSVERWTLNPTVVGSSPTLGAYFILIDSSLIKELPLYFLLQIYDQLHLGAFFFAFPSLRRDNYDKIYDHTAAASRPWLKNSVNIES